MDDLKKKHDVLIKLIHLEKSNLEKTRREFVQLKTLLEKAEFKEKNIKNSIHDVESKIRKMMLVFENNAIDTITQYRLFIDNKNNELAKQIAETQKIRQLFENVSKSLNAQLLKLRKLEEKNVDTVSNIKLEMDKKEIKQLDDMWLQRLGNT